MSIETLRNAALYLELYERDAENLERHLRTPEVYQLDELIDRLTTKKKA